MGNGYTTVDAVKRFSIKEANTGKVILQGDDSDCNKVEARIYTIN